MKITYQYRLKKSFHIGYMVFIAIALLLTVGRWLSVFYPDFHIINANIHSHISNLSLSMIFYLGVGCSWLLSGVRFRYILFLGIFTIISNFVCETFMGFMNTTDIVDAYYGAVGVVVVWIYLFATNKYGLLPMTPKD